MKKNRNEVIQFIRTYHQDLYKKLEEKVKVILEEDWVPSQDDVNLYNSIVKQYCKDTDSVYHLQPQLLLS